MKYLISFAAMALVASAMPTQFGTEENSANFNGTSRIIPAGLAGFATLNGGTYGGNGGAVWTVWDAWALRDAVSGNNARIIYVRGRIDLTALFTGSPGVFLVVGNFKTIIGGDRDAMIYGGGLKIYYAHQVIIHNLKFHNALSYAPGEQPNGAGGIVSMVPGLWSQIDAIDIEATDNVWVNHCELDDSPWIAANTPEDQRRHNGQLTIKSGSNWITISNTIFRNHNLVLLIGHDDNNAAQDIGKLKVSFYLNWFQGTIQRNPMVRYGEVHVLNNLYTDIRDYAIGIWTGALVYAESNVFVNTRTAWGFSAGTPNPMGNIYTVGNSLVNSAYDASIPNNVGWNPSQYYSYSPMAAGNVEWHVRTYAGVI